MKTIPSLLVGLVAFILPAWTPASRGQSAAGVVTLSSFPAGDVNAASSSNGLIQSNKDGNFYGSSRSGGSNGSGSIFRLTPTGALNTEYSFSALSNNVDNADGAYPYAALAQDSEGNLYGTTVNGGANGSGTIFKITTAGTFTTLHSFAAGQNSYAGLTLGRDGNLYGGSGNTIFRITPAGVLTTINQSTGLAAALTQGRDGNFYGVGETIFELTPSGVLTTLHPYSEGADIDGSISGLVQGSDGDFYGVSNGDEQDTGATSAGHYGTVFKVSASGELSLVHHFTDRDTDGAGPDTNLIAGTDGNLYGTTPDGGTDDFGTIYQITPAGVLTTLYSFTAMGTDGAYPSTALVQGSDGGLYGTTQYGGSNDAGTFFKVTLPPPVLTSALKATANVGSAFSYRITATGNPTSFAATGLPTGLTVNTTGLITGTPKNAGKAAVTISATGADGTGTAKLMITITAAPAITSATTASATVGEAFTYQITATNKPTSFAAPSLPTGLTLNAATGEITGAPKNAGKAAVTLSATNANGTGTARLTLTITD